MDEVVDLCNSYYGDCLDTESVREQFLVALAVYNTEMRQAMFENVVDAEIDRVNAAGVSPEWND